MAERRVPGYVLNNDDDRIDIVAADGAAYVLRFPHRDYFRTAIVMGFIAGSLTVGETPQAVIDKLRIELPGYLDGTVLEAPEEIIVAPFVTVEIE